MMVGDFGAAWRAMLTPENLGPMERDALLIKWGIRKDSFKGRMTDLLTNPAVLASVFLTFKFPIPTARNLFKAKEGVDGMLSRIPLLRTLAGSRTAFANTPVPDILDGILHSRSEIWDEFMERRLAPALTQFEAATGRAVTAREQVIMFNWLQKSHLKPVHGFDDVGVLMPGLDKAMTSPMRALATEIRGSLDDTRKVIYGGVQNMGRGAGAEGNELRTLLGASFEEGLEDYVPHRIMRTELDIKQLREATLATANNKEFARGAQYKMTNFLGREFYQRKGGMIPAMQELTLVGDLVDPQAYMRLQNAVRDNLVSGFKRSGMSKKSIDNLSRRPLDEVMTDGNRFIHEGERDLFATALAEHMPAQYSMKMEPVLQNYYHSVANTFAWTVRGHGRALMGEVNRAKLLAKVDSRAAWRASVLENTVVPSALGRPSPRQVINAGIWDQRIGEIFGSLERPSVRRLMGDKVADGMKEYYQANQGSFSLRGLTQSAASYFYLSTLGLNPGAAFKNQFQGIITTGPLVGFKNYFGGQLDAWKRAGSYFNNRTAGKLSHAEAMAKTYPEFAAAQLVDSPLTDEVMGRAMDAAYRIHKTAPGTGGKIDRAKRFAMALFSSSEISIRLGSFHAGLRHAKAGGLKGADMLKHARQTTVTTQFVPTLTDQPIAFGPAGALSNALIRQLAQFPLKTLEFTIEGVQQALAKNPARLSRQIAGAYITSEIGDVLGLNLGDALIGGALPTFTNVDEAGRVLAPLPIVPPAIALTAGLASGLANGDWDTFRRQMPLLVPGGIGLAKAVGFAPNIGGVPHATAQFLERRYADYANTNPMTGRIPIYTGGGSLTGYYKPWEITRYALGIKGGAIDQEAEAARRLSKDADLIRDIRRRYTEALFTNDPRKAARISSEYRTRFGHRLSIPEAQIRTMQERRKLTRIERQLSSLPKDARPQYEADVFGPGSALRESRSAQGLKKMPVQANYTDEMGLLDELDPYAISRYRSSPTSFPGR